MHSFQYRKANTLQEAADWLAQPQRLAGMRDDLRSLRGQPGAVAALAAMVQELLPPSSSVSPSFQHQGGVAEQPLPPAPLQAPRRSETLS